MEEVSAIYTQNLITDLATVKDAKGRDLLIATSLGLGFGAPKERDPYGGESSDRQNKAAQFTVLRDINTTEPLELAKQNVLGPFDGVDGTAAFKMGDIQNDVLVIDTRRLTIPPPRTNGQLQYALLANRYQAHDAWVRYTSDSAEVLAQDVKGDIAPELQRVVGAFPESVFVDGDNAYIAMLGTNQLVDWRINAHPQEAWRLWRRLLFLTPVSCPGAWSLARPSTPSEILSFVTNFLGETLTVIDKKLGSSKQYQVGDLTRPFPDTNAERGESLQHEYLFRQSGHIVHVLPYLRHKRRAGLGSRADDCLHAKW